MAELPMTPKQAHREQAADLHRDDLGLIRCILRRHPAHECGGRLQAHHVIEAQRLGTLWDRNFGAASRGRPVPNPLLLEVSRDALIADGRNAAWVCEIGHRQVELGRFALPVIPLVGQFAAEYGIEHEPPLSREEAA